MEKVPVHALGHMPIGTTITTATFPSSWYYNNNKANDTDLMGCERDAYFSYSLAALLMALPHGITFLR